MTSSLLYLAKNVMLFFQSPCAGSLFDPRLDDVDAVLEAAGKRKPGGGGGGGGGGAGGG
jgi:hypothetical protein